MWSVFRRWRAAWKSRRARNFATLTPGSSSAYGSVDDDDSDFEDDDDLEEGDEDETSVAPGQRRTRRRRMKGDRRYFGEELWGTSARQRSAVFDEEKLRRFGLPSLRDEREVAAWLDIPLPRLRWFTHDRAADTTWHYVRYIVPKRSGGQRVILAPKRELKALQRRALADLVGKIPIAPAAHGFVPGRSITTNARPHVGKRVVIRLDLKDFFPSITFPRVRGVFIAHGYSYAVASTLALLCTEYDREPFDREGKRFHVSVGPRHLVQGAPTSPALANLVAWRLDRRLTGLAAKYGFGYTRYADDLTFSGDDPAVAGRLITNVRRIVADERFMLNDAKTRVARRSRRQVVTGLVVNDQVATPRQLRRRIRAMLHNAQRDARGDGMAETSPALSGATFTRARGLVAFVNAVNPQHAAPLWAALRQLKKTSDGAPDDAQGSGEHAG
jgi:retron-type reverse transcriptase